MVNIQAAVEPMPVEVEVVPSNARAVKVVASAEMLLVATSHKEVANLVLLPVEEDKHRLHESQRSRLCTRSNTPTNPVLVGSPPAFEIEQPSASIFEVVLIDFMLRHV